MSLTRRARSSPEGRLWVGTPGRLGNALTQLPDGGFDPLQRALGALAGDHVEQLGQVRRPGLSRYSLARGDAAGAVPDHARRHRPEARPAGAAAGLAAARA